jgi:hypothetical protein
MWLANPAAIAGVTAMPTHAWLGIALDRGTPRRLDKIKVTVERYR